MREGPIPEILKLPLETAERRRIAAPLLLGLLASAFTSLFFLVPQGFVLLGVLVILALSAVENEAFLSLVIFLTPLGWVAGKTESIFSAFPSRSNIDGALLVRCAVVLTFFAGRFLRGRLELRKLFQPALAKASAGFMAAIAASAILSEPNLRPASMVRVAIRVVAYLGFFLFLTAWCDSVQRVERVAFLLLASALVTAAFALAQMAAGGYTFFWHLLYPEGSDTFAWDSRATSFFDYPNDLASYLNLILPLALGGCVIRGWKWKGLAGCTFALGTAALVCTEGRAGMLGYLCMLLAAIQLLVETWRTRILLACGMACAALVSYLLFLKGADAGHLGWSDLSSGATRLYLWAVALQLFRGSPIHGVGWGNFQVLYGAYLDPSLVGESQLGVHNTYLSLLAEAGIPGFVTFLALLVLAFRQAVRRLRASPGAFDRALGFAVAGAIVALLVEGCFEFQIAVTQYGVLFWTLLALLTASARWPNATNARGV